MLTNHNSAMWCPCKDCRNMKKFELSCTVHAHLIIRGFMAGYICWNKHGQEGINEEIDLQDTHMEIRSCRTDGLFGHTKEQAATASQDLSNTDIVDMGEQIHQMPDKFEEMVRDAMCEASTDKEIARLEALMKDAKLPLYPNCPEKYTKIFSCLKLLQLKAANHWTDQSFKGLLDVLRDMLPNGNHIPETHTRPSKQFALLG